MERSVATRVLAGGAGVIPSIAMLLLVSQLGAQTKPRDSVRISIDRSAQVGRKPIGPAPRAAPPGRPVASPVTGYEIVMGATVEIAPLTVAAVSAQCPANKVALSAGLEALAAGDATFGMEVLGAWTDGGRNGEIKVRNANVFVRGTIRPYAVCIADMPGRRQVDVSRRAALAERVLLTPTCAESERLAGGGSMTPDMNLLLYRTGPSRDAGATTSYWATRGRTLNTGMSPNIQSRAICYPQLALRGWQLIEGPRVSLGAHGQSTISARCPSGTVPLAFGVVNIGEELDLMWNTLVPSTDGTVSAHVHNLNLVDSNTAAFVQVNVVCAERA
jgi:hypothetical protein